MKFMPYLFQIYVEKNLCREDICGENDKYEVCDAMPTQCQNCPKVYASFAKVVPNLSPGSAQDVPKSSSVVLSYTNQVSISQQMSRVIAFDIAVVAQKVNVVDEDRCGRDGYESS